MRSCRSAQESFYGAGGALLVHGPNVDPCMPRVMQDVGMNETAPDPWIYVVTDIEVDGPWPGANSMRSFASVAVKTDGVEIDRFEAVLEPLPGAAQPNADTHASVPDRSRGVDSSDEQPGTDPGGDRRLRRRGLKSLPEPRMFAASPIAFDGGWVDYYLRRFTTF